MEILKKTMTDPGFPPEECSYGKVDENTIYYFIKDYNLENGNIIATPNYKEAIGHSPYSTIGVINSKGQVLIPFENKAIKAIKDQLLLVEKNVPTTNTVVEALKNKSDPFAAQTMAQNATTIKKQLKQIMGMNGDFIFDNQFSEAAIYTMNGVNVANNYFSFIGENNGDYYLATNVVGATIMKFNPNQLVQSQTNFETESEKPQEQIPQQNITSPSVEPSQNSGVVEENTPPPLNPNNDISIQDMKEQEQPPIVNTEEQEIPIQENDQALDIESPQTPESEVKLGIEDNQPEQKELEIQNFDTLNTPSEVMNESTFLEENSDLDGETSFESKGDDELEEEEKVQDSYEDEEIEEKSILEKKKDPYNIEEEDIKNPTIADATNTIIRLLEENRNQRQQLDKDIGTIEALESNVEILRATLDSVKLENQSLAHERNEYRTKYIDSTRELTQAKGVIARKDEIIQSLESQNADLKQHVAGMHALSNAINEAGVLIQPVEDDKVIDFPTYQASNLDVDQYLNNHYINNHQNTDQDYSYFTGKHQSSSSNTNEGESSYRRSRVA